LGSAESPGSLTVANPGREEVQITLNPGVRAQAIELGHRDLGPTANGEITLTDTDGFYRCTAVGPKN
jgi:hypothetical protein